ncbi:MAG: glycoside hydrolase family 3 C-terminal domain-containing protein [Anaerolineales bacterium]|nr:glycoside hydrolase family 3 C-terminal domain-containing protein [Anaerolineales bacterium]
MDINQRVDELNDQLTLLEKISLLSGRDIWNTVPIERLGISSIVMTDGPHGVRSCNPEVGRKVGPATAFPTGISMGACWNITLMEQVGRALGEETRGMGCDILLGPCVNLVRDPRGGRNFETFSEDPYLAGNIAVPYIKGVQSCGVGAALKHYAVNNYEIERFRASSEVDERALRELYLTQFEIAVKEAQPWTVMCSYNRVNGTYASENGYLLNDILRGEWGFEGAVISDWGAVHSICEPVANGLDLEMPGPALYFKLLLAAVRNWQLDPVVIDQAARRILKLVIQSGRMDKDGPAMEGWVNTPEHRDIARRLAEDSITLLKNENQALPIRDLSNIAILGPNAAEAVIGGGGSSRVIPASRVSPLQGLQEQLGDKVELVHEPGCDNFDEPYDVPAGWLAPLRCTFYARKDFTVELLVNENVGTDFFFHIDWSDLDETPESVRWEAPLTVPVDGNYHLTLHHAGPARLLLDGEIIFDTAEVFYRGYSKGARQLKAGQSYILQIESVRNPDQNHFHIKLGIGRVYPEGQDFRFEAAVEAARNAEAALVFVGMPEAFEREEIDREGIDLMSRQNELISAVAAVNPRTIVILNVGSPVHMPWAGEVAAVLLAYYPGQENGNAVTRILTGEVNPSGKLPVTFPRRLQDGPAWLNAARTAARKVHYGEGIFLGYRWFDHMQIEPLFPFGHGLSYTTFEYSDLYVPGKFKPGENPEVRLTLKNTGDVTGQEVVQLYVGDLAASLPRPPRELKGFTKVALDPGESRQVSFSLDERAFAFYDPVKKSWVAEPGEFRIMVGSSSRDIRLVGKTILE